MAEDFKAWLRRQMRVRGQNQSQLALELGKAQSVVQRWLAGGAKPDEQSRAALADYFGIELRVINDLLGAPTGLSEERLRPFDDRLLEVIAERPIAIPIHDQGASAGFGQAVIEYAYWTPARVSGRNIVGLRVHGKSMEPEYRDGDVIYIDTDSEGTVGSKVVATIGDQVYVKKLVKRRSGLVLSGNTGDIPADEAKIEGRVIGLYRDEG